MSFWIPTQDTASRNSASGNEEGEQRGWHENDYCEIVRDVAGDLVENVELVCLISAPPQSYFQEVSREIHRLSYMITLLFRNVSHHLAYRLILNFTLI